MRGPGARPVLAAALAACCGCSFVAVRRAPPSPPPPGAPLECTQSSAAPGLDTAGAIVSPLLGLSTWGLCTYVSAMQSWSSDPTHMKCGLVLWATILSTAAYTGSAVYGYSSTAQCRRLAEQLQPRPPGPATPAGGMPGGQPSPGG